MLLLLFLLLHRLSAGDVIGFPNKFFAPLFSAPKMVLKCVPPEPKELDENSDSFPTYERLPDFAGFLIFCKIYFILTEPGFSFDLCLGGRECPVDFFFRFSGEEESQGRGEANRLENGCLKVPRKY